MLSLGFTGQIKLFGFARIFSELTGEHLTVFDRRNCISPKFKFFETLFIRDDAVSYIQKAAEHVCIFNKSYLRIILSDSLYASISPRNITDRELVVTNGRVRYTGIYPTVVLSTSACALDGSDASDEDIISNMKLLSLLEFKKRMRHYLQYTEAVQARLISEKDNIYTMFNFPKTFDIGVHIRTGDKITSGEMNFIPIERYIEMIKQNTSKSPMNIFVMSDGGKALQEFNALADHSWNIYSTTITEQCAHVQDSFNDRPVTDKINEMYKLLAEIEIMKTIQTIFCTLSSNIGFLIYFLHPMENLNMISIDAPHYIFSNDPDRKFC